MKLNVRRIMAMFAGLALVSAMAGQASAAIVGVGSRGALGGTDSVDWGSLGGPFTGLPNPALTASVGAVPVTASQASGSGERRDQGTGWAGNFSPGDELYWTNNGGPLTLFFSGPAISAVGANIQADYYGAYTALIEVFGPGMTLLGSHSLAGNATSAGDGSAIFLGVRSTDVSTDFNTVRFTLTAASAFPNDFAINQVDFASGHQANNAVPEPTSMAIFGLGGLGLALASKRARRKRLEAAGK